MTRPTPRINATGQPDAKNSAIESLLRELVTEQRQTNSLLKQLVETKRKGAEDDQALLEKLLPKIVVCLGTGILFRVRELFDHPQISQVLGDRKPHNIGMLLSQVAGDNVKGLTIARSQQDHGTRLWQVVVSTTAPDAKDISAGRCDNGFGGNPNDV